MAERGHTSFLSGLSAQQPAPPHSATHATPAAQQPLASAHLATYVASAARQPPASANLATLVAPPPHSLWRWAPPRSPPFPPRRNRSVPPPLPQPGPWYPLPSPLRLGLPCPRRLPENPEIPRPPHPGRSWSHGPTGSPNTNRPS